MSDRGGGLGLLSATLIEHVDTVCDRFERSWKGGLRPRIEECLAGEGEPGRSVLLHELLVAELGCRQQLGEHPARREYLERFPDHSPLIDAAFARAVGARADADSATTAHVAADGTSPGSTGTSATAGPRFRVLRPHAEGGLGVISIAHDAELHREVALKEIQPRFASRPESRDRFLIEAEINGRLEHPGIVPVYSLGRHPDGRPYYAMRLIEGISLKEAIEEYHGKAAGRPDPGTRSLELRRLLDRFRAVCEAVAYAHSRGVLHRDVKPQNIMIGPYGETFLVDWGLAKVTGQPEPSDPEARPLKPVASERSGETRAGSTLGTPPYMSPEQAEGRLDRLGPASDVYGLGATLYHLLTGRPAFEGSTPEVLAKVRRGEFPKPRMVRPDVPRALEAICLKAMAPRPGDRYATARELAVDIERWQADEPVSAWREPWPVRALRWAKRHRTAVIAFLAAVLLTTIVLGGCVLTWCVQHVHLM
jgi:serine/threonine-protein kinase